MLVSMTGFGRAVIKAPFGELIAEVQSVNRKYLEVFVSLPQEFGRFEQNVRAWISEKIARGQVSARFHLIPNEASAARLLPNSEILSGLKQRWEKIARELDEDPKKIDLPFLMLYSPIQQKTSLGQDQDLLSIEKCLKQALQDLIEMKRKEGKALCADMKQRLVALKKRLKSIESLSPEVMQRLRDQLAEKIGELHKGPENERLIREIVLFADRVDISEEITRLESHFEQFQEILHLARSDRSKVSVLRNTSEKSSSGRKMEFLIQEIGREINTIGSKSPDVKISHLIIEMKSGLEQIREQVQNIE